MPQQSVKLPKLSELPLQEGDPHHSAWGLYGKDDELGTLNRLTDEVVLKAAREEIRTGVRYEGLFYEFTFSGLMTSHFCLTRMIDFFGSVGRGDVVVTVQVDFPRCCLPC